jgi:hypothetical protein
MSAASGVTSYKGCKCQQPVETGIYRKGGAADDRVLQLAVWMTSHLHHTLSLNCFQRKRDNVINDVINDVTNDVNNYLFTHQIEEISKLNLNFLCLQRCVTSSVWWQNPWLVAGRHIP